VKSARAGTAALNWC